MKGKVAHIGADMSKPAEVAAMVTQAKRELGGVDIMVNEAAAQIRGMALPVDGGWTAQ
jgi:NAD(P)-dependent dehydrogenase (short-subunit alcohol dehydrogenase family)